MASKNKSKENTPKKSIYIGTPNTNEADRYFSTDKGEYQVQTNRLVEVPEMVAEVNRLSEIQRRDAQKLINKKKI